MSDDPKLEPCPFCGSEAKINTRPSDPTERFIRCGNDDCAVISATYYVKPNAPDPTPLLVDRWNRRTTSAPHVRSAATMSDGELVARAILFLSSVTYTNAPASRVIEESFDDLFGPENPFKAELARREKERHAP